MKIAVFDSGIGGLSVLHLALKKLPNENFIYFADKDNVPYGTKSKKEILKYVDTAVDFMLKQNIKAIVVACNTATSAAIKEIREKYKDTIIIGMEPAVKKAVDLYPDKKVLVIATPLTVKGEKMNKLISKFDKNNLVNLISLPKLVEFAENKIFNSEEVKKYLEDEFKDINFDEYSSIVLGCTHFNYFKKILRDILPKHIKFLDGNEGTINKLKFELEQKKLLKNKEIKSNEVEYFYSGRKVNLKEELETLEYYLRKLDDIFEI
ncbi:MAG: glutamate racemase [Fusobacterium sp.]|nr:glutamate racemase [Fusobacterium sp.]